MAEIKRTADATWRGDLKGGAGVINTNSGVLSRTAYSFATRFEDKPGTNPEELIAAAHAACYSMAFAHALAQKGHAPESITTRATCILEPTGGGFRIARMHLQVRGVVPGLDNDTFKAIAVEADKGCPVSNLLRCGLTLQIEAALG
jgi:osmotically inducible protein OsmC